LIERGVRRRTSHGSAAFIDKNGGGSGVRLLRGQQPKTRSAWTAHKPGKTTGALFRVTQALVFVAQQRRKQVADDRGESVLTSTVTANPGARFTTLSSICIWLRSGETRAMPAGRLWPPSIRTTKSSATVKRFGRAGTKVRAGLGWRLSLYRAHNGPQLGRRILPIGK
jgi:hypothetical protein